MSSLHPINSFGKADLKEHVISLGEKKYRAKQLWNWLYVKGAKSFSEMNNIGKELIGKLTLSNNFQRLNIYDNQVSNDGTRKWVFELYDGNKIETVFIPEEERGTLCISSQVGCTLACSFCHTGTMPLVRNLTSDEIVGQLLIVKDCLDDWHDLNKKRKITNIVFMGMGEPLYNYDEVKKAIQIFLDNEGLNFSRRKITLSTSGVVPKIEKLKNDLDVSLAISLHAVCNEVRNNLVPINRKWPIEKLLEVLTNYPGVNNSRRITFEYVMLEGINDTINDAKVLIKLLKSTGVKTFVIHSRKAILGKFTPKQNLIPFNPWPGSTYKCSSIEVINKFADVVCSDGGIVATVRQPRGQDILAACGQLKSDSVRIKNKFKKLN